MAAPAHVQISIEVAARRSFAVAVAWPGWSRAAKTPEAAIEALLAYRDRYAAAIEDSGEESPRGEIVADVIQRLDGDPATEYGVPGAIADADRRSLDAAEAGRRARIVEASWATFDRIAAAAPVELRKGPRGGGRDTAKVVEHVVAADHGYCRELGPKLAAPDPKDRDAVAALRSAMLEVLRRPSDGSPIVKRWTARYAAQRIAWHALDHAWEIEDRSD